MNSQIKRELERDQLIMERRLHEAAITGSVSSLLQLLDEDPLILDRVIVACHAETPLHVAAMLGHFDFVREILCRKPELASEKNLQGGSSPLHLASAKGYVDIVRDLLSIDPEICLVRDREGRTPLHLAAMKCRVEVLRELIRAKPEAIRIVGDRRDNILHMCVKYNQLEALKLLVKYEDDDSEFMNSKNDDGNTLLHLAVADKQIETIKFLLSSAKGIVNVLNRSGFTAMDVLDQGPRDLKDWDIGELLREKGARRARDDKSTGFFTSSTRDRSMNTAEHDSGDQVVATPTKTGLGNQFKKQDDWLKKMRSSLMVVASLIATMAFQVGVNPPGGVWQEDILDEKNKIGVNPPSGVWQDDILDGKNNRKHIAGLAIMFSKDPGTYSQFLGFNTIGFIASLSIILLLISGLPMKKKIFIWILMVIMWIAITSMALTYVVSVEALTRYRGAYPILGLCVYAWLGLMGIIFLGHTIRLMLKLLRKIRKRWGPSNPV